MSDWNDQVIAQFRAGDERIADMFDRSALLLLHSKGAKTGQARITPLVYLTVNDQMVIVASAAGADKSPAWYFNLLADPDVTIERWQDDAIETLDVKAVPAAEGPERDALWAGIAAQSSGFAQYQTKTSRVIPVVTLQPA